jgi:hypothetical protein
MTSKSFSFAKTRRFKTKSLQEELKNIKTTRIRNDRRTTKQILKNDYNQDLPNKILINNGSWDVL